MPGVGGTVAAAGCPAVAPGDADDHGTPAAAPMTVRRLGVVVMTPPHELGLAESHGQHVGGVRIGELDGEVVRALGRQEATQVVNVLPAGSAPVAARCRTPSRSDRRHPPAAGTAR